MEPLIARILDRFSPISLEQLNGKAAMLERVDNKYIIPAHRLRSALESFSTHFDVLEIDGRRTFTYATSYFDDPELHSYYDHHQGRRKRCKVRVRDYVDAGLSYLEVKLKDRRQITVKKRLRLAQPGQGLNAAAFEFIECCHRDLYAEPFARPLRPVIRMRYQRITLVAKEGGERMTIDTELEFHTGDTTRVVDPTMFIIETKSARGNGRADHILRSLHVHPTKRCSKYCIGMAATGQVARRNRFLPALRRLDLLNADVRPTNPLDEGLTPASVGQAPMLAQQGTQGMLHGVDSDFLRTGLLRPTRDRDAGKRAPKGAFRNLGLEQEVHAPGDRQLRAITC